ncbi:furin-like protease 1 [Diaphorina citri]|uniref:Furin-like protease 1 n=1 Tax=Diaphorina citri TaxID=121845 RepID=A0A3Q0IJK3_DIACI|nr:furin-like protease 1 [Diaphorina citri]
MAMPLPIDMFGSSVFMINRGHGLDMNVQGAWEEGITGKGVVITILDDGLEKDHPDLIQNYDPLASYDVNSHDDDPMPRYDQVDSNRMEIFPDLYHLEHKHVAKRSADPSHHHHTRLISEPVVKWAEQQVVKRRSKRGFLKMPRTVAVTRTKHSYNKGRIALNDPKWPQMCSTLATTYSSGSSFEHQVVTTDLHHDCTSNHTGTSASAPLAAGICALALEANPGLTWRDMQHIVVATARPANLRAPDWATNGVGRNVSHSFGYGLMDATAMVRLARQWKTVPEQFKCEASPSEPSEMERPIPAKSSIRLKLDVTECPHVNYLEHVQARVTLSAHRRGDLQIVLVSPAGTRATLLATRPHDSSKAGFNAWPFMSVHSWGEQPFGSWYLEIHNEGRYFAQSTAWSLVLHGTETAPVTLDNKPVLKSPPLTRNISADKASPFPIPDVFNGLGNPSGVGGGGRLSQRTGITSGGEAGAAEFTDAQNGACKLTPVCVECGPGYFLYDGKCTVKCPVGTYQFKCGTQLVLRPSQTGTQLVAKNGFWDRIVFLPCKQTSIDYVLTHRPILVLFAIFLLTERPISVLFAKYVLIFGLAHLCRYISP